MAYWHASTGLSCTLASWLLSLLVLHLPALPSTPLATLVGKSISLPIPFSLPSAEIPTSIVWRKNMTSLATGFLTPNFTVVIASSYQSRFSVDSVKGNLNITAVATSDSGIYTVEVFPLESAVRKGNVIVMVYEEPDDVSVTISPPEVIEGDDSVGLTCGPVRGTISWTKDGQSLGANNRYLHSGGSLQISHPQRMDAGIYHCTISNPFGNGSSSAQLTVYYGPDTPTITISSLDQDTNPRSFVLVNSSVTLTCLAPSHPPAEINWNVADAQDLVVPFSPTLQLPRVQLNQAGSYSCLAINRHTRRRVRNTQNLIVAQRPIGSLHCSLTSADNGVALLFACSWLGGSPAPHLSFQGLPGHRETANASNLHQLLVSPFPAGLSGKRITCLGQHLTGQGNCTLIPEAPSQVSLSFQTYSDSGEPVAMELHCRGTFNPVEIEWFRDKRHLVVPTGGRYQLSTDGTRLTIWNFTAPQDLGKYSAVCSNPLGSQHSNITVTGPAISNWTVSRGPHPGSAFLTWTVPKGSVVTSFWIQMQGPQQRHSSGEWKTVQKLGAANRSTTIVGLQPQELYAFQILPRLGSQAGNASYVQTLPPDSHLSAGSIVGIVIGSILGILFFVALLILLFCCFCTERNKKAPPTPPENQQHYLSRQFPNGNKLEPNDFSWGNPRWSSGDSDIYAITYEKHLGRYGGPATLPFSTKDSSTCSPTLQSGPKNVRSATQV